MALSKIVLSLGVMACLCFGGSSLFLKKLYYVYDGLPKSEFVRSESMANVYHEKGGEAFAKTVADMYEKDKKLIETTHGFSFLKDSDVFLCVTQECYDKYAVVTKARAETHFSGDIIMNGYKLADENRTEAILAHELSHAIWFENGVGCMPRWWEEGLATLTSNGGGAENTSVEEAIKSIKNDKVFEPIDTSSCRMFFGGDLSKKYGISWSMYYRQSEMFVGFLREYDRKAFGETLKRLKESKDVYKSIADSYKKNVETLWGEWIESIKSA